jgi:hypothetical protein
MIRCRAWRTENWLPGRVELLLADETPAGLYVAEPTEFTLKLEASQAMAHEPTLRMSDELAAAFLQALWDVGIRPNSGAGMSAETDALKAHIKFAERVAEALIFLPRGTVAMDDIIQPTSGRS